MKKRHFRFGAKEIHQKAKSLHKIPRVNSCFPVPQTRASRGRNPICIRKAVREKEMD